MSSDTKEIRRPGRLIIRSAGDPGDPGDGRRLTDDATGLWIGRISARAADPRALAALDGGERRRFATFRREADRIRFLESHWMLRRILGRYLGIAPGEVRLTREPCPSCRGPHGRPALADASAGLHFSLSHGGDLAMVGVAATAIGVDVLPWPAPGACATLSATLHPAERAEYEATATAARPEAFSRLWARKEAYLKGLGTGLSRAPHLDDLGDTPAGAAGAPKGWAVHNVPVAYGYAAAVALREPTSPHRVTVYQEAP